MKKCANTSPKLQPKQRIVRTPLKPLKTQGLHTHQPVTTPPHRISWRWSRVGMVCVLWVGLVVCVVGGVWVRVGGGVWLVEEERKR